MVVKQSLPRSTCEDEGIDPHALLGLLDAIDRDQLGLHSLIVLRHGRVVAEGWWAPYTRTMPHMMFSVSKSFVSSAIGIAQAEGRLSIDEPVLSCFPSYGSAAVRHNVAEVRVRDLLAMASGHEADTMPALRAIPDQDWIRLFLEIPLVFPPGTHFTYNNGASFVLATIVASRTGENVLGYLTPRLFEPLGIAPPQWDTNERGLIRGSTGLRLCTEDLAKFAQLYLQRGAWEGDQLIPEEWVHLATTAHVENGSDPENDWCQGYGFQFWRSRHNSYRADGAYGQFGLILPEQDLVVAITSGSGKTHELLQAVWDHLLPGVTADGATASRPAAATSLTAVAAGASRPELDRRTAELGLGVPDFLTTDPTLTDELADFTIVLPFNTMGLATLRLVFEDEQVILESHDVDGGAASVSAGRLDWVLGTTKLWSLDGKSTAVAARGGWIDERTVELHWQCVEGPFRRIWRFYLIDHDRIEVRVGPDLDSATERTEVLNATLQPGGPGPLKSRQ